MKALILAFVFLANVPTHFTLLTRDSLISRFGFGDFGSGGVEFGNFRSGGFGSGGFGFDRLNRQRQALRGLVPSPCASGQTRSNGNCIACSTVSPACSACSVANSKVTCTACISPAVLRNGTCFAPDDCSSAISNCTSCAISETPGVGVICKSCASGYGLRPDGRFCDACSKTEGCLSCISRDGGAILCTLCEVGRGLDLGSGASSCPLCATVIAGCAECADGDGQSLVTTPLTPGSFICTRCVDGLTLTSNNLVCE